MSTRPSQKRTFIVGSLVGITVIFAIFSNDIASYFGNLLLKGVSNIEALKTPYGLLKITTSKGEDGLTLAIQCVRCELYSERLAPLPFISETASLAGKYHNGRFQGHVRIDAVTAEIEAKWQNGQAEGSFTLPETKISELYYALRSIIPEEKKATIHGSISGKGTFTWPGMQLNFTPDIKDFKVKGLVPHEYLTHGAFSHPKIHAEGTSTRNKTGEGTEYWLPLGKIGSMLPAAVIATEDGSFYSHPGYDLGAIAEAAAENAQSGKLGRGGSTLSQQLAKNLFLKQERTFSRKFRELLYAVELEEELGKKRILELYLNLVQWGPGIWGAKQAADTYFGKPPPSLRPEEAAWLASILRNPAKGYKQQFKKNKPQRFVVNWALNRMKNLSDAQREEALQTPIRFQPKSSAIN